MAPVIQTGYDQALLVSYLPAFDEVGEVVGISVAVVDITARKRTEAAPRESEDLFHTANASCVGIGLDFRIALNERICDLASNDAASYDLIREQFFLDFR